MKSLVVVLLTVFLGGCGAVFKLAPSYEYCQELEYTRKGIDIDIKAKCKAPLGD